MTVSMESDVGGAFTDVYVTCDGRAVRAKSDTTAFDPKLGFFRAVIAAAEQLDRTLDGLLAEAETIVYSTTVGTNALIEHRGPRLGLITTAGFEDTLMLGRGRTGPTGCDRSPIRPRPGPAPRPLVPRHLVAGLRERIDSNGTVLMPARRRRAGRGSATGRSEESAGSSSACSIPMSIPPMSAGSAI